MRKVFEICAHLAEFEETDTPSGFHSTSPNKFPSSNIEDTPLYICMSPGPSVLADFELGARQMNYEIVTVNMDTFLQHYAPFCPEAGVVERCIANLVRKGLVRQDDGKYSWTDYPKTPSKLEIEEAKVYTPLVKICDTISQETVPSRSVKCRFVEKPHSKTASETSGSSHKVDGYLIPKSSTVPTWKPGKMIPTADLALNAEFKLSKAPGEVFKNRIQCFGGAMHCMNEDVRRTHTYSMTIEDSQLSLWYWSRSHSAMSIAIDFTTDVGRTVRALMAFLFASMEELGYDSAIQRRYDSEAGKLCLVFKIREQYFKTTGCIFEHHSIAVGGRATRVYEAVPVASFDDFTVQGSPAVIKYAWLDHDASTESDIQCEIFAALDTLSKQLQQGKLPSHFVALDQQLQNIIREKLEGEQYKSHFLTIKGDARGQVSKSVHDDAVPTTDLFAGPGIREVLPSLGYGDQTRSTPVPYNRQDATPKHVSRKPRTFTPKRQYFVVFEERGQALHNLEKFGDVVKAMKDCFIAVTLLFLTGWIHRDISSGNLLWYSSRGILADLEYAKRFSPDQEGRSDPKTGTAFFMVVEVANQGFLRLQSDDNPPSFPPFNSDAAPVAIPRTITPRVVHNFSHDIESFFWILLWTIMGRVKIDSVNTFSQKIFVNAPSCPRERHDMLVNNGYLALQLESMLPGTIHFFPYILDIFRRSLVYHYQKCQWNDPRLESYSAVLDYGYQTLDRFDKEMTIRSVEELNNLRLTPRPRSAGTIATPPSDQSLPPAQPEDTLKSRQPKQVRRRKRRRIRSRNVEASDQHSDGDTGGSEEGPRKEILVHPADDVTSRRAEEEEGQ